MKVSVKTETAAPLSVRWGEGAVIEMKRLSAALEGSAGEEATALKARLRAGTVAVDLAGKTGEKRWIGSAPACSVDLAYESGKSPVTKTRSPRAAAGWLFSARSEGGEPALLSREGEAERLTLSLGKVILNGSATLQRNGSTSIEAVLDVGNASFQDPASKLALSDISGAIPFRLNGGEAKSGPFRIGSIRFRGVPFPTMQGTASVRDSMIGFDASLPLLKDGRIDFSGRLALGRDGMEGDISAAVPPFALDEENRLEALFPALKPIRIRGSLSADASFRMDGGRLQPRIDIRLERATVGVAKHDFSLRNLNGAVSLHSLDPLETPPSQRAVFDTVRLGDVTAGGGSMAFRLEGGRSILIENLEIGFAGGLLRADAGRFDIPARTLRMAVVAEGLRLKDLLDLVPGARATGEGTLVAKLPVEIQWPRISIGEGFIRASPGAGRLQLKDASLLGDLLNQQDPRFTSEKSLADVKDRLVEAFRDLDFSRLDLDFIRGGTEVDLRIHTAGKGRGPNGQEIGGVTVFLRGINSLLEDVGLIGNVVDSLRQPSKKGKEQRR
jgi:hypothetical protein